MGKNTFTRNQIRKNDPDIQRQIKCMGEKIAHKYNEGLTFGEAAKAAGVWVTPSTALYYAHKSGVPLRNEKITILERRVRTALLRAEGLKWTEIAEIVGVTSTTAAHDFRGGAYKLREKLTENSFNELLALSSGAPRKIELEYIEREEVIEEVPDHLLNKEEFENLIEINKIKYLENLNKLYGYVKLGLLDETIYNKLNRAGVTLLTELCHMSNEEILKIPHVGKKMLTSINEFIEKYGIVYI